LATIVFVEDSPKTIKGTISKIKHNFPFLAIKVVERFSEFESAISSFELDPPILFVFDLMLPSENVLSDSTYNPMEGGKSCLALVKESETLSDVPIVILTAAPQLVKKYSEQGVQVFSKLMHEEFFQFISNYVSISEIQEPKSNLAYEWFEEHCQWIIATALAIVAIIVSLL